MQSVFYSNYSTYEGEATRLYRSCDEIKRDIKEIKRRIATTDAMLNVRNMLTEAIAEYSSTEPEMWIPELRALVDEADNTLDMLRGLKENLDMLRCELEDARWALEA